MKLISRRQVLGGVCAAVAAGTGLKPRRARAAGELTVWWTQGFYKAENDAVIAWMADWEKRNNTKVNLTIMNGPDVITKLIAGMQVGDVPDVVHTVTGDRFLVPRAAWNDQLEDVSDVVESQKTEFLETALNSARLHNAKQKKNSYYAVPTKASSLLNEVWLPLLEEAGFAPTDMRARRTSSTIFSRSCRTSCAPRASVSSASAIRWRRRRRIPAICFTNSWLPMVASASSRRMAN